MDKILIFTLLFWSCSPAFAWLKQSSVDKMTDEKRIFIGVESVAAVFSVKKASLIIRVNCKSEDIELMVSHPWIIERGPVKLRFDKDDPIDIVASPSTDQKAIFLGDNSSKNDLDAKGLIEKLKKSKRLVINYPEYGKTVQAEFKTNGLDKFLKNPCK